MLFDNTKLKITNISDVCLVCYEITFTRVHCCNAAICDNCYYKWLQTKRQCMHCKADQCDFEIWVNKYRIEPEFDPQEYIHELLQDNSNNFDIQDMLTVIQQTLQEATGQVVMIPPNELLPPDVEFELQYGYTVTPTDIEGNHIGPGITVMDSIDYSGNNEELYGQIQGFLQQYQELYEQTQQGTQNCTLQ